jgi:hypothetical protein
MATRRKYRPKAYRDGGRVLADTTIPESSNELSDRSDQVDPAAAPSEPAIPPHDPAGDDAVARAFEAQRRAEELQRQPPPPPQLSERRIAFIRQHPELADPANEEAVVSYWKQGLRLGIPDDTNEIDAYVLHGLRFEREARAAALALQDTPAPRQAREEASQPAPMPAPPARRSMQMVAPVSREAPSTSGRRQQSTMRLTEEERDIARLSDTRDVPDVVKEYEYAKNKKKYESMKADGSYTTERQR